MIIQTKHFGNMEIIDDTMITFFEGIPGFEQYKKYVVVKNPDPENPFHWLQCVDNPALAFVVINPLRIMPEYDFAIDESILKKLQIEKPEDLLVLTIAVIPEEIEKTTVNLKAPIVINVTKRYGKQLVLDDKRYPTKYFIFQQNHKG